MTDTRLSQLELAEDRRRFAKEVAAALRNAGFESLWAGGCVRDTLMGTSPVDYDVATSAHPEQVRELFGRRRTLAVGAAFGVIIVKGPTKSAGQVEVATFRTDSTYSDGRRPDSVTFSTAEEDALRRDFTINGMFLDPSNDEVLDYVGGKDDLAAGVIRAIGDAEARIAEDKLRMLRAVRFAARFGFQIESNTRAAITRCASDLSVVSGERMAAEMRKTLQSPGRNQAVRDWAETDLLRTLIPQLASNWNSCAERSQALVQQVSGDHWISSIAAMTWPLVPPNQSADEMRGQVDALAGDLKSRLKLANEESAALSFALCSQHSLGNAHRLPWSQVQPWLIAPHINVAMDLFFARCALGQAERAAADLLTARMQLDAQVLDPKPLLDGGDLHRSGLTPGPLFRELLSEARARQLDGELKDRAAALEWLKSQSGR
ncbi:MAG: CCA tRNA nucleotidyltransferase [Pirellulales bacterium]